MSNSRDSLFRAQHERDAAQAPQFAVRVRAKEWLFARGWADDPWSDEALQSELRRGELVPTLEDVGRSLLANERFELLEQWLSGVSPASDREREAIAVVRGLIAIRSGDNEAAAALLNDLPHEEAVALHGLALLQLGRAADAASRLEVLLAANALDEQGVLPARLLPEDMPALALFLTACVTAAERLLAKGERGAAENFALAARDAYRRYAQAEVEDGPSRDDVVELLRKVGPAHA